MIKVVIVGLGTMGSTHAASFTALEDVNLIGVVDTDKERAEKTAEKYNTKSFTSFEDALNVFGTQIDLVSICLPTDQHLTYVKKTADIGADVICEKPLARTLSEAKEMMDYCQEKETKLFVGHVVRFFPEYVKTKKVIESEMIGQTAVVRTFRGGPFPKGSGNWYRNYDVSGGLILDMIIHDFDFLRWCFGNVKRVYAKNIAGVRGINEKEQDYALVTLRFENGIIAHVEGSWTHREFNTSFEFAGDKGVLTYNSAKEKPVVTEISIKNIEGAAGVSVPESPLAQSPYDREIFHFIECIRTGQEPLVTAMDAYKAMEISIAALQSIEEKKPVELNSILSDTKGGI